MHVQLILHHSEMAVDDSMSMAADTSNCQVVYVDFCGIFFILPSYYVTYCRCFGIFLA